MAPAIRVLVLAEPQFVNDKPPEWILHIPIAALAAQIVTLLLVYVVTDLFVLGVVDPFENVLNLLQVIALVFLILQRVERCVDFNANNVTKFALGIDFSLARVAGEVNHDHRPQ
jgi:hypothetical protein